MEGHKDSFFIFKVHERKDILDALFHDEDLTLFNYQSNLPEQVYQMAFQFAATNTRFETADIDACGFRKMGHGEILMLKEISVILMIHLGKPFHLITKRQPI